MRTRTTAILLALGAVAVTLGALGLAHDVQSPASPALGFRWKLPEGTRLTYQLAWSTSQRVPELQPAGVEGHLELTGSLELRSHGRRGDAWWVEARLVPTAQRFDVVGQDLLAAPGALGDATAWAELSDDGTVRAVEVARDAPALWKNLASQLFGALEVIVPPHAGAEWHAVQRGAFGRGEVTYSVTAPQTLVRVRGTYSAVDGLPVTDRPDTGHPDASAEIRLGDGHLDGIEDHEHLVMKRLDGQIRLEGEAKLSLVLGEVGRFEAAPGVANAPRTRLAPGERVAGTEGVRNALRARIDGLTAQDLMTSVLAIGDHGIPDEDRWMWRATGLLRLEPALCGALAQAFREGRLGRQARAVALDLLAGAATPEAQAAMRTALASGPAREQPQDWVRYVQRLSFLDRPTAETVAFARELRDTARAAGDVHGERAASYVLGNLAGSLGDAGDAAGAGALAGELARDLGAATTAEARAALLAAYGAARRADAVDVVKPYLADASAEVRRSAVDALAETTGAGSSAALVGLAGDRDTIVQGAVFAALGGRPLADDALVALRGVFDAGGVPPVNDLALAAFAVAQRQRGTNLAPLAGVLAAVASRTDDPQVRALIRQALSASS